MTVGTGTVILTQAPPNQVARVGVAFELLDRFNPTSMDVKCKAFMLFSPAVKDQLVPCAQTCHSPGKNNTAVGAFNMADALSSDTATLQAFCVRSLGRIQPSDPSQSIMIRQVTPQSQGGTPNHPFKQTDATALSRFVNAVQAWATAEK
jgi:hypothetical protein